MKKLLLFILILPLIGFGQTKIRNTQLTSGNQPSGKVLKSDGATNVIWGDDNGGTGHDSITIAPGSTGYFEVNYPQIFSGQKLIDSLGVINTKIAGKEPTLTKGNLTAGSSKVTIGGTGTNALIGTGASVDINEANIVHQNISGSGTNTHAQIDTHITNDLDLDPNNENQDLSLSGNTLSLSGDASSVDLSVFAPTSGSANYVQVSPLSPQAGNINMTGAVKLGNLSDRSGLSRFLLSDSITGSISAHGFADNNLVDLVGVGYNSFDSKPIFGGSSYYDHAVAFQSIPEYASSGNIGTLYGMFNRFKHTGSGIIDKGIGIYLGAHSGAGTFNKIYGVITQQGAGNNGFGIETPATQVQIDANGLTSPPANSGTTPSSGTNTRFSAQSKTSAILDIGNNGSDGLWLQATDYTNLAQKYSLLLNPTGGDVVFGGKVRILPNSAYYGEQIQINEFAPKVTFRADGGYYWSAGVTSSADDAKFVIRYESDSKDLITIDRSYNILFGGDIDAPIYKLSGVDLYSSLTANTLQKWDGTKHTSIALSSGYFYSDGTNMSWIKTVPQSLSGTTPALNASNGVNANLSISGATILTLSNLISGTSGAIYLTNNASVYRIKIAGYTIAPASNITYDSTGILLPASSVYTHTSIGWYYNGTTVQIHKADYNLTTH